MDVDVDVDMVDVDRDRDRDVDRDLDGWEAGHRAAYGCGAWERACRQAGVLVAWCQEQSLGPGALAPRRVAADPGPRAKWPWGDGPHTVGLVLWRAAFDAGVLIDEVPLADTLRHCAPGAEPLAAGPLPDGARNGWIGFGSAESVARIRHVLQIHVAAEPVPSRPAAARPTLGHRVRELRATPDWEQGDWPAALARARAAMRQADDQRERGTWLPTAQERSAGRRTGLDRLPADEPAAAGGRTSSWLTQASRLVDLAAVLSAAADALPRDGHAGPGPLAHVLDSTAGACTALRTSTEELGHLWAAEPHPPVDPDSWEASHVPGALRTQTEETQDLLRTVAVFLWVLACG
ncbi:hypothetical protein OG689_35060 [Kitasatospora sp. NBC_00240]|uniref:hypothetical protein n=1 Tax=Kitasatospora sp. NBC_00240 TaxID=2903567 RepID=UPI00224ED8A1|nr:hypothetical protein [Kitasatospora sp. NBC_00240]MCX5214421.1 hypothetical protein [Kitasatospora sp. NBC_00240]